MASRSACAWRERSTSCIARADTKQTPIVGIGGVQRAGHAWDLLRAGANLVAVGTESFRDPLAGAHVAVRFHDLRHTFGTRMAAAGVPLRTLPEWMGHADSKTSLIYADYLPADHEAAIVDAAFAPPKPTVHSMEQVEQKQGSPAGAETAA